MTTVQNCCSSSTAKYWMAYMHMCVSVHMAGACWVLPACLPWRDHPLNLQRLMAQGSGWLRMIQDFQRGWENLLLERQRTQSWVPNRHLYFTCALALLVSCLTDLLAVWPWCLYGTLLVIPVWSDTLVGLCFMAFTLSVLCVFPTELLAPVSTEY